MNEIIGYDGSRFCSSCSTKDEKVYTSHEIREGNDGHLLYTCKICREKRSHPFGKMPTTGLVTKTPVERLSIWRSIE